jgi:hypothetical protein
LENINDVSTTAPLHVDPVLPPPSDAEFAAMLAEYIGPRVAYGERRKGE